MPLLPSGLSLCISWDSIVDFTDNLHWPRSGGGQFWLRTPNLALTPSPYQPWDEIVWDFVGRPIPSSREEAMQSIQVLIGHPDHRPYWRGDWLDTFEETFPLSEEDRAAWRAWLATTTRFLDQTIDECARQVIHCKMLLGKCERFPKSRHLHVRRPAIWLGRGIAPETVGVYTAEEWAARRHRGFRRISPPAGAEPPLMTKAEIHDFGIDRVASWMVEQGCRIEWVERRLNRVPQIFARRDGQLHAVMVRTEVFPRKGTLGPKDEFMLEEVAWRESATPFFAGVGIANATDGHNPETMARPIRGAGFYVAFNGLQPVALDTDATRDAAAGEARISRPAGHC